MANEIITFGCRLNAYESEVIKQNLEKSGLEDFTIFNTCAVTKEAERQAKQTIRKYIRNNPNSKVIVTGCGAQIDPQKYSSIEGVFKVIGNEEKLKADTFSNIKAETADLSNEDFGTEKIQVNDIFSVTETASHMISGLEDHARAFMQVQNGCNHRCTFCIIPYGRGNSRSVPVGEIAAQAKILVDKGYNEIVLTGVDITDYGLDLPGAPRLGKMVRRVLAQVPNLARIRLSSVDVAEIDDDIYWLLENEPRFMPYFHLSLQAGDNMVLKRMKRRHTRENILEFFEKTRAIRPDVTFGADIIAGFPTETDEMFDRTLKIIQESDIIFGHIFPYSEREGTPAAKIPASKQVPVPVRKERAKLLREACAAQLEAHLKTRVGKAENVIIEKNNLGRTEQFCQIKLKNQYEVGKIVNISAGSSDGQYLFEA